MDKLNDLNPPSNYLHGLLKEAGNDVTVLHFKPDINGRDEFGNRVFSSRFQFEDRDNRTSRSGILVTPDGDKFLAEHPEVLKQIDHGLEYLTEVTNNMEMPGKDRSTLSLGENTTMSLLKKSSHSNIFRLEIGLDKYIVKCFSDDNGKIVGVNQPFINEVLQIDYLKKYFGKKMVKANLFFPKIYFATPFTFCREYVDGSEGLSDGNGEVLDMCRKITTYVQKESLGGDSLWKDVKIDWDVDENGHETGISTSNIIKRSNGQAVWIDPLRHVDLPS